MSLIEKFNVLAFIKDHLGSLISILLIIIFFSSISLNVYFLSTKTESSKDFSKSLEVYKDVADSLEIHVEILEDSLKQVKKYSSNLESNRNKISLELIEQEKETQLLIRRLDRIRNLKLDTLKRNLTNEEIDDWLIDKFGIPD